MRYTFTSEYPESKIDEIVSYLLGPRLWIPTTDYPDFFDWAERTYSELKKERKRAIIALCRREVVGAVVYQRHKKYQEALEIKNLTVRPDQQGRSIASFLLRNAEVEGIRDFGSGCAVCDAKEKNLGIRAFLVKSGYVIAGKTDLYGLAAGADLIYRKSFGRPLRDNPAPLIGGGPSPGALR